MKPDPTGLFLAMERLGVAPEECVYCGDSSVDMDTGANAGIYTIGAEWGFHGKAELDEHHAGCTISSPSQLPEVLRQLMAE